MQILVKLRFYEHYRTIVILVMFTKLDGIDKLTNFLQSPEAENLFNQEAKVIRQVLNCDAAIYVIDVREPVLPKYHDELAILANSDKPILAVLNFTSTKEQNEKIAFKNGDPCYHWVRRYVSTHRW